jgi:hypothetical protein
MVCQSTSCIESSMPVCSISNFMSEHIRISELPAGFANAEALNAFESHAKAALGDTEFTEFNLRSWLKRLVVVTGDDRSRVACGCLCDIMARHWDRIPDELRGRYGNAPRTFADAAQPYDGAMLRNLLRYVKVCVLDNVDRIDPKHRAAFVELIGERVNDRKITIITVPDVATMYAMYPQIADYFDKAQVLDTEQIPA